MLTEFLYETFRLMKGDPVHWFDEKTVGPHCAQRMSQAVDRVADEIFPRMRAVAGYKKRLQEPLAAAFKHIDSLASEVPPPIPANRRDFNSSPELSAFFVNFNHLQEVFNSSRDVRDFWHQHPDTETCYALVCMDREERRQPGIALVGDRLRKDVMQTAVSFSNHQVVSPGQDEEAARCALKCCMFKALAHHARRLVSESAARGREITRRRAMLARRLSRSREAETGPERTELQQELARLEAGRGDLEWPMETLDDRLDAVVDILGHPERFLVTHSDELHLDRMGIKQEDGNLLRGIRVPISEVRIGGGKPRTALLMSFPRSELLPEPDFLQQADLFLATSWR